MIDPLNVLNSSAGTPTVIANIAPIMPDVYRITLEPAMYLPIIRYVLQPVLLLLVVIMMLLIADIILRSVMRS